MPTIHAVAIIEPTAGFDMEASVNTFTFHFAIGDPAARGDDAAFVVSQFFNNLPGTQTDAIGEFLSPVLSRAAGGLVVKCYDITTHLDGSPHGSPVFEEAFTLVAANNQEATVNQVAGVVTLRGRDALLQPVEGPGISRPRSRRTGRNFIGPLNVSALDRPAGGHIRPITAFRSNLNVAMENVQDTVGGLGGIHVIWSRAAQNIYGVTSSEVDDSFDVLRSRKLAPTVRDKRVYDPVPLLALGA